MSSFNGQSGKVIEVQALDEVEFRDFFRFIYLNRKGALLGAISAVFFTLGWLAFNLPAKAFRIGLTVSPDSGPAMRDATGVTSWLNQALFEEETRRDLATHLGLGKNVFDHSKFKFEVLDPRSYELKVNPAPIVGMETLDTNKFVAALNKTVAQRFDRGSTERVNNFRRSLSGIFDATTELNVYYKRSEAQPDAEERVENLKLFEIQNELDLIESRKSHEVSGVENSMFLIDQLKLRAASLAFRKQITASRYEDIRSRLDVLELDMRKDFISKLPRAYLYTHISEALSQLETSIRIEFDPRKVAIPVFAVSTDGDARVFTLFNRRGLVIFAAASLIFLSLCGLLFSGLVKFFVRNKSYITKEAD